MQTGARIAVILAVLATPPAAFGQSTPTGGPSAPPVKITLYPSPEPRPALRYQLLPPLLDRRPGNAAVWWNRMTAERTNFFAKLESSGGLWDEISKWMDIPLGDPREKTSRPKEVWLSSSNPLFGDMDRAARFETCDWEQPVHEGEFFTMLLPEIQQARSYSRLLSAKAHLEIAEGRYDAAVRTFQTGFSQARQVAQSPTVVSGLVGVTIASIMSNQVQEFIQRPDAPNLYWALSTLPRPLVSMRLAGETESIGLYLQFPELRNLDRKQLSPDEWRALLKKVEDGIGELERFFTYEKRSPENISLTNVASILAAYPRAKRYLAAHGRAAAEVEAMPVAQVILLYSVKIYDDLMDDQYKWFFLPAAEAGDALSRAEQQRRRASAAESGTIPSVSFWAPAAGAAKNAETRLEWNMALLRVFEAMRLYVANHDGRWPDRLNDITEAPVPLNPCDGRSFIYVRRGDKAVLSSEKGPPNVPWRYEITLKQKQTQPTAKETSP